MNSKYSGPPRGEEDGGGRWGCRLQSNNTYFAIFYADTLNRTHKTDFLEESASSSSSSPMIICLFLPSSRVPFLSLFLPSSSSPHSWFTGEKHLRMQTPSWSVRTNERTKALGKLFSPVKLLIYASFVRSFSFSLSLSLSLLMLPSCSIPASCLFHLFLWEPWKTIRLLYISHFSPLLLFFLYINF